MSTPNQWYLSLDIYPNNERTIGCLTKLGERSIFERGTTNKVSTTIIEKRYDCLVRMLSSIIAFTRLDPGIGLFRSQKTASFTDSPVPYRVFMFVSDYLVCQGYLSRVEGQWSEQIATTFHVTQKLIDYCEDSGVTAKDLKLNHLVRAKYPKGRNKGKKLRGKRVADLRCSKGYEDQCRIVDGINHYLTKHALTGVPFVGLFRLFNEYNEDKATLDAGGRLYAEGGSYQVLKSDERLQLKIDGEAVAEIDISASHFTLIHLLARMLDESIPPLNDDEDPYTIPGIPRAVTKQWIVAYSSKLKPLIRWSPDAIDQFKEQGIDLANYKVKEVGKAIALKYPFMDSLPSTAANWGYLQRRESDALIMAMQRLSQEHNEPAYPVHDSLIVKQSAVPLVTRIMKESFASGLGFTPKLKIEMAE